MIFSVIAFSSLSFTVGHLPGTAPSAEATRLQGMARQARADADAPGLGLVVMHAGEAPRIAVSGVRIAGEDTKIEVGDAWHWGSITKTMTSTLVGRLVEKGVVSWDDTIGERLGSVVPNMQDAYRDVSFIHLLTHRSGLQANIPNIMFGAFKAEPKDRIADRLRWVRIALTQEPKGPKEETYEYSNNGYIVIAAMLEAATGKSWEDLMRKEVFAPLDLFSAGFGPPRGDQPDGQPRGHTSKAGEDQPVPPGADNPPAFAPAGRVHMSLADMATYLNAHATRRPDFLKKETYERLHSAPLGGFYGLGWVVTGPDGRFHNGSNTMWYAEVAFSLTDGTVAAVVVNDGDISTVQPTVRKLLQALMKGHDYRATSADAP